MTINPKILSTLQSGGTTSSGFGDDPAVNPGYPPSGSPAPTPPSLSPAAIFRMRQQMSPQLPPTHPLYNSPLSNLDLYSGPQGGTRYVTDIANRVGTTPPPTLNPAGVENHMVATGWQPVPPASAQVGDVVGTPGTGPGGRHLAIYAGTGQIVSGPGRPASYLAGRQGFNPSGSIVYRPPTVPPPAPFVPARATNLQGASNLRPPFLAPMDARNPHKSVGITSTVSSPRAAVQPVPTLGQPQKPLTTAFGPSPVQRWEHNVQQFGQGIADFSKLIVSPKVDPKNVAAIKNNEQFQVPFQSLMGLLSSPYQLLVPAGAAIAKGAHAVGIPVSQETMDQANANSSFTDNFDNMFGPMFKQGIVPDWMHNRWNDQVRQETRGMTDAQLRQYAADQAVFLDNGTGRGPTADQMYRQIVKIRSGNSQDIPIYRNVVNEGINYPGNFGLNALLAVEGLHGALESGANLARSRPTPPIESTHGEPVSLDVEHQAGHPPGTGGAKPPRPEEPNVNHRYEAPAKAGASSVLKAPSPEAVINESLQQKFGGKTGELLSKLPDNLRDSIVDKIVKGESFTGAEQDAVEDAFKECLPGIQRNSQGNYIRLDKAFDNARVAYTNALSDNPHPFGFVGTNNGIPFARQTIGDFGEELAVEHLKKLGYTDFSTLKNASGHGIDIIAKNGVDEWVHFEVKSSPTETAGGLAKEQRGRSKFIKDRVDQAAGGGGKWKNAPPQMRDHGKMLKSAIENGSKIQGYKVEVHEIPNGPPGHFVVNLVPWKD